tara:strand:+ start:126 stop:419 length:294 start_codon:yes stop_codon:yes gene_type:complete
MKDKITFSPPRYSRAYQTGWDNLPDSQEKIVTVTLTLEEVQNLIDAALDGQVARRFDIESMRDDPDVERSELTHFRARMYRTKRVLDEIEKKITFSS